MTAATAGTLTVGAEDGDFTTIQEAIDSAGPGDMVVVAPGEYSENAAGSLDLAVPSGHHRISLRLEPPWQRRVGLAVSGAAAAAWLVLIFRWPWRLRSADATV